VKFGKIFDINITAHSVRVSLVSSWGCNPTKNTVAGRNFGVAWRFLTMVSTAIIAITVNNFSSGNSYVALFSAVYSCFPGGTIREIQATCSSFISSSWSSLSGVQAAVYSQAWTPPRLSHDECRSLLSAACGMYRGSDEVLCCRYLGQSLLPIDMSRI
jgi:hypothetical protein